MTRQGLRQVRKPNTTGASLISETQGKESPKIELPYPIDGESDKLEDPRTNLGQVDPRRNETSDKSKTNLEQSQDESRTELRTNLGLDDPRRNETSDKSETELRTSLRTNLGQSHDKSRTNQTFSSLVGLQRNITLFIYRNCQFVRSKMTDPLTISHIAESCKTTTLSAQKTIQRLEEKAIIIRGPYKIGRAGWTRYELPNEIFQEIFHLETQDKVRTNFEQTQDKIRSQIRTEPRTGGLSSSSILIDTNLETTTDQVNREPVSNQLSPEWESIDCTPLSHIKFGHVQLQQLFRLGKLTTTDVQDSINAFAFDLIRNGKGKTLNTSPLNYFMGILRKGPYAPPENYESPEDEARRKYLESKRSQVERRKKIEAEIFEFEFEEWKSGLTKEQRFAYAPDVRVDESDLQTGYLKNYFERNIYKKPSTGNSSITTGSPVIAAVTEDPSPEDIRAIADAQFGPRV